MSASIPALITPQLLKWAREEAGYTVELASEAIRIPVPKLQAWEDGKARPTLRQAEKLAKTYHRPFTVFLLPSPPQTTPLAAEYRRLPGIKPGKESPELRVAIRDMLNRRQAAIELLGDLGDTPPEFSLGVRLSDNIEDAAGRLRSALNLATATQLKWTDAYQAWRGWREAVENLGVLVFQFGKVDIEQVRGLTIPADQLPVIGVNTREIAPSRPFTLLHELVHLGLSNAAEEKPALDESRSDKDWAEVERFAERITSAILVPAEELIKQPLVQQHANHRDWEVETLRTLANRFKVTPSAMATRLLNLGRFDPAAYNLWRVAWDEYQKQRPQKNTGGFATPVDKALGRNGRTFTALVLDALATERITPAIASRYLDLGYQHIEELRHKVVLGGVADLEPIAAV
jgi:Zn-dependent peptidase ImmA (M78 family)